jgi:DNA-binding LytR/AlgR family response regulator
LLFVAGFGAIVFILMFLVRVALPWMIRNSHNTSDEPVLHVNLSGIIILILSSVAFTFYLRYVGFVGISFYIVFKIVLISFAPPVALRLYDANRELRQQNESLISEKKIMQNLVEKFEEDNLNKSIEFISENKTEILTLLISEIAFIKSADNYVEIVYKTGENFKKNLIRNTLRNIELQLKEYSNFIRCHRICIVNKHYIEKLGKSFDSHWITIKGYNEQIPVSRQYLLKLKEAL